MKVIRYYSGRATGKTTKGLKEAFEKFLSLTGSKSVAHPNFSLPNEYLFNGVPIEIVVGDGLKGFEWLK